MLGRALPNGNAFEGSTIIPELLLYMVFSRIKDIFFSSLSHLLKVQPDNTLASAAAIIWKGDKVAPALLCPVAVQCSMQCTGCALDRFTKNFFWIFKKWIVNSMEDYQTKHVRIFFWSQMSLLHKVLDPPSYTRDLQRAKF